MQRQMLMALLFCGSLSLTAMAGHGNKNKGTISISGVIYEFNTPNLIAGATVSLELPDGSELWTVSDANGNFVLTGVPTNQWVTPKVDTLDGYQPMWHQTFKTHNSDISMVYLQTVPDSVYQGMAGYLAYYFGMPVDPSKCQVVSTVASPAMSEVSSWEEFKDISLHGLAGATAQIAPEVTSPIYFSVANEYLPPLPTPGLPAATADGGVLWENVEPGDYVLTATTSEPNIEFPAVHITCEAGRLVNASPPWGLTSHWED